MVRKDEVCATFWGTLSTKDEECAAFWGTLSTKDEVCATFRGISSTKYELQSWLKSFVYDQWAVRKDFLQPVDPYLGVHGKSVHRKLCCSVIVALC